MKLVFLSILLTSLVLTPAFAQTTTTIIFECDFYSDSTFQEKIARLAKDEKVFVEKAFYNKKYDLRSCLVVHDKTRGYVYFKYLKRTPELDAMMRASHTSHPEVLKKEAVIEEVMLSRPKNNIYGNLFGDASTVSVNYERLFMINPYLFLAGKAGLGVRIEEQLPYGVDTYTTLPFHATVNVGIKKHFLEFGYGVTADLTHPPNRPSYYNPTKGYVIVGYRFQPLTSDFQSVRGIMFRLNILYFSGTDAYLRTPIGISIGGTF
jgi:hypothetical protein